jgi:hypothetical protein
MSTTVQHLLESFDALTEADKHQVAVEILRRWISVGTGDLPEEALIKTADELFRAVDAEEAGHARTE